MMAGRVVTEVKDSVQPIVLKIAYRHHRRNGKTLRANHTTSSFVNTTAPHQLGGGDLKTIIRRQR
jgi:hypothetical protein